MLKIKNIDHSQAGDNVPLFLFQHFLLKKKKKECLYVASKEQLPLKRTIITFAIFHFFGGAPWGWGEAGEKFGTLDML